MQIMNCVAGTTSHWLAVVSKHLVLVLAQRSVGIREQTDVLVDTHPQNSPIDSHIVFHRANFFRPKAIPSPIRGENAQGLLGNGSISISGHNITGF